MRRSLVHFNCSICTSSSSISSGRRSSSGRGAAASSSSSCSITTMGTRSTTRVSHLGLTTSATTTFLLVPGGLVGSFPSHLLWILVILLLAAADAGINQVQSQTAPVAMPISSAKMGSVLGLPLSSASVSASSSSSAYGHSSGGSSGSNTLINSNSSTSPGNFSDLGDIPFENNTFMSITVPIGDTAFLKCTVKNLGNRTISWIRRRDMHIITVDRIVYTNDERFNILHADGSDDWTLQIKFIQRRDNGTYEAQVSSGKGISTFGFHVFVVVPEAFILGNGEYHIQQGSTINLVCIVEKSPKPPEYIFWYHNDRMINFGSTRDLSIQTETGSKTQSRLIIENAQVTDSGNYTCETANAEPASTLVYISQGDKMAAIQRRKSDGSSASTSSVAASSAASSSSSSSSLFPNNNSSKSSKKFRAVLEQLIILLLLLFHNSSLLPLLSSSSYFIGFVANVIIITTIFITTTTTPAAFILFSSSSVLPLLVHSYLNKNSSSSSKTIPTTNINTRITAAATAASSHVVVSSSSKHFNNPSGD